LTKPAKITPTHPGSQRSILTVTGTVQLCNSVSIIPYWQFCFQTHYLNKQWLHLLTNTQWVS